MEDNAKIRVKNRSHSPVIYTIPEMNGLRREYNGLEEKTVTFEEIRKLSYLPGGDVILKNYLTVKDKDALTELNLEVEPEYFYEIEDVKRILSQGSMDEFLDCLDFAPAGVIDMVKELAVEMPLNDVAKRKVLKDKFDYDVDEIIKIREATIEGEEEEDTGSGAKRRAAVPGSGTSSQSNAPSTGRRVVNTAQKK